MNWMRPRHLVVIGTSSGGLEALCKIVADLPLDFPAAIAAVMHTSPHSPPILHTILARYGRLPSINPADSESLRAGTVYVAPPDFHLLIERDHVRLTKGPKENDFDRQLTHCSDRPHRCSGSMRSASS